VLRRLRGSVFGLRLGALAYGILAFVCACFLAYGTVMWLAASERSPRSDWTPTFAQLFLLLLLTGCLMAMTAVLSFGAHQMRLGLGYPFALAAAVAALLPITPLILLTAPFGLRALARLSEPEVKAAFGRPPG
jgi:hypothetical protein